MTFTWAPTSKHGAIRPRVGSMPAPTRAGPAAQGASRSRERSTGSCPPLTLQRLGGERGSLGDVADLYSGHFDASLLTLFTALGGDDRTSALAPGLAQSRASQRLRCRHRRGR